MDSQRKVPPNEILIQIFQLLPRPTIHQCIFVCKSWSFAAIQTYYKHLLLNGDMINLLQVTLSLSEKNKNPIMAVGQNGEYVKSLTLCNDKKQTERFNKTQLITILSNMPYLKKIDISSSKKCMHYLKQLWDILKNSNTKDIIKGVEEVDVSSIDHITKRQYFQVCYALRDTLTHVSLARLKQTYAAAGITSTYLNLLPQFTNLTHLHIRNRTYRYTGRNRFYWGGHSVSHNGESNLSIQSVLNACSKLTHLRLESDVPIVHDIMDKSGFDTILLAATGARSKSMSYYYYNDNSKKQRSIYNDGSGGMKKKVVFLLVPNLSVRNFMDYISPHVSTLNLSLKQDFDIWVQDIEEGKDTLKQELDRKCCTIKDLTLSIGDSGGFTTEEKNKLRQITLEDRIMAFQKFVDMIGRTQDNLLCTMDLDLNDDSEDTYSPKFDLTIKNGVMNIKYAFRLKDDGYMVLPSILGSIATADKKMQLFCKLYSIKINLKKVSVGENRMELQEIMNQMVASLVTNCDRLAFISINCGQYRCDSARYKFSSDLYDSLQNGGVIPATSYLDFMDRPICRESLSRFVMKGLEVSPAVLDILNKTLGNVRSIKLQECIFNKDSNNKCIFDKDSKSNVTLDLSSIQHLDALVLDVSKLGFSSFSNVFFLTEYINKDGEDTAAYYQCQEKGRAYDKRLSLVPTTFKYIHSRNRLQSKKSVAFTIKLSEIGTFSVYHSTNPNTSTAEVKFDDQY